jgi:hypothetical protein
MEDEILSKLEKIDIKVDRLQEDITEIKITAARHEEILIKQEKNIDYHILRTDLLQSEISNVRDELKPIHRHVNMVSGALKLIGLLGVLAGIAKVLLDLSKH